MANPPSSRPGRFGERTRLVQAGRDPSAQHGFVNTPIYRGSTVLYPTADDLLHRRARYVYGTAGTPTTEALERAWTELTGAAGTVLTPSGLAAVSLALLSCLKSGDHLLMTDSAYRPTRVFCDTVLRRFGVETTYYDPLVGADIAALLRPNTAAVFTESPGSQSFEMQDVPAIAAAAHARGAVVLMDNTWATPLFFKPPRFGIDIGIYAATKYICGHSDMMMGIITCRADLHHQIAKMAHGTLGQAVSADDCYQALRGLRTLHARLTQHQETALALARWLAARPEVEQVLHPAFPGTPGHEFWKRDVGGSSGLFGVVLKPVTPDRVDAMLNGMRLFCMGYSWGGYESLMVPAGLTTSRSAKPWPAVGRTVRIHAGLEDPEDLIADLEDGLARLRGN